MSRGLGKVQRKLLVHLREHQRTAAPQAAAMRLPTAQLASLVYYDRPHRKFLLDPEELSAVRRALGGLADAELVHRLGAMNYGARDCYWRTGLWALR